MKTKRKYIAWVYVIAAGWFLAVAKAHSETINYTAQLKAQETRYKTPEDLLSKVPFLGSLPRTFLVGDGYTMKLSADKLRIDHMGRKSRSKGENRTCMLGLRYTAPTAFFTTRVDIPLMHSPTLGEGWKTSAMGDYVLYMSRLPVQKATLQLALTARF